MSYPVIDQFSSATLTEFCRERGVRSLRLFGSRLHGHATPNSDLDILVEFEPNRHVSLFDLSRLQIEMSDLLDATVDLRTPAELSRYFRDDVLRESIIVFAQ